MTSQALKIITVGVEPKVIPLRTVKAPERVRFWHENVYLSANHSTRQFFVGKAMENWRNSVIGQNGSIFSLAPTLLAVCWPVS